MADLSLFQSLVSSCASLLPRLKKEEQKEAVTLLKKMLPNPMVEAMDFEEMNADEENAQKAETSAFDVKGKISKWWRKRRSIDVFEENVEESKRQRKKRKSNPLLVAKVENSREEIAEEKTEQIAQEYSEIKQEYSEIKQEYSEIKVEGKISKWWTKRRSVDVFEENVEESKRQRKKRKSNHMSVKKVENSPEEIVEEITEKDTEESSKEIIEELVKEITQDSTKEITLEITDEITDEDAKENGENTEESGNNTETNTLKKSAENKKENTEDDTEASVKVKVLDSIGLRAAAVAEILMMRKRNALMRKRLSQKPTKRSFSRKLAECHVEEKVEKYEISTSTEVDLAEQSTLIKTLGNNVKEVLKPAHDRKIPNDDLAEILPKFQNKAAMVEVADEIGADDEMMTKLDLHENDINSEEELRMSLEAEDVEEYGEEEPFEEQTKVGKNKEECLLEPIDKQTKKTNKKVATRLQKRTRKGE